MTTSAADSPAAVGRRRRRRPGTWVRVGMLFSLALGLGAAGGVVWWSIVDLPTYKVGSDGGAATTERGLAEFVGGDAWFTAVGVVAGISLGVIAWRAFRDLGWILVLMVVSFAVAAELVCWFVGVRLGPGDFSRRLAAARPGDLVPIELTLRTRAALLTWPFFAVIPVLLGASLGRDDEEPKPIFGRKAKAAAVRRPQN